MDKAKMILGASALTALLTLGVVGLIDPTRADQTRLDAIAIAAAKAPKPSAPISRASYNSGVDTLIQNPIFVMTTGASAYSEKTLQIYGVSISNMRKAALVSIGGAASVWMRAGELNGDIQLTDVDASAAHFDTPLGARDVRLNDPAPNGASTTTPPKAVGG